MRTFKSASEHVRVCVLSDKTMTPQINIYWNKWTKSQPGRLGTDNVQQQAQIHIQVVQNSPERVSHTYMRPITSYKYAEAVS